MCENSVSNMMSSDAEQTVHTKEIEFADSCELLHNADYESTVVQLFYLQAILLL